MKQFVVYTLVPAWVLFMSGLSGCTVCPVQFGGKESSNKEIVYECSFSEEGDFALCLSNEVLLVSEMHGLSIAPILIVRNYSTKDIYLKKGQTAIYISKSAMNMPDISMIGIHESRHSGWIPEESRIKLLSYSQQTNSMSRTCQFQYSGEPLKVHHGGIVSVELTIHISLTYYIGNDPMPKSYDKQHTVLIKTINDPKTMPDNESDRNNEQR